jgi:hypothetical protein
MGSVTVLVSMLELIEGLVFGVEQCAVLSEELVVNDIAEHNVAPPGVTTKHFGLDLPLSLFRPLRSTVSPAFFLTPYVPWL